MGGTSTPLSQDVAQIIRELPSKVAAIEKAIAAKVGGAAALPSDLQAFIDKVTNYLTYIENLNLPDRLAAIEAQLGIKAAGASAPGVQGTAAQRTATPAKAPAKKTSS
jgi:hypothetical protein